MTTTPLESMSNEELSALVATEMMGGEKKHPEWYWFRSTEDPTLPDMPKIPGQEPVYAGPKFATSIADAWEARDAIGKRLFSVRSGFANELRCLLRTDDGYQLAWPDAIFHLEPRHICIAALRAVGWGEEG